MPPPPARLPSEPLALLAATLVAAIWSAIGPHDRLTWWLEVTPVLIALPVLLASFRAFPLTPLVYRLIFLHALVLIYGAHYTYALTPAGFSLQELFGFARNPWDRIGHLMQGAVPAMVAREILLRRSPLVPGKWLFFIVCCICLAISATYEFLEWWGALILGEEAEAFLAMQGDIWDTQWDMLLALIGAALTQLALQRLHDRHLAGLASAAPSR